MPIKPSRTSTHGRNMAGARSLWRATGMRDADFGKPIVAVVNSQTDFVPGHMHLWEVGRLVAEAITAAGGVAREMNTIAIDDGIAMGHEGMLYSLPSRELIADSIEYMARAHCVDALVCISNCDKITPGMLMAALRLNLPTVFLSGGPMEAGRVVLDGRMRKVDLADAMVMAASDRFTDEEITEVEAAACPTCGSCSGLFTANSMNCLLEALGLALPGNGTLVATHVERRRMAVEAGRLVVHLARRWYDDGDAAALPRSIATRSAFENAMTLDVAMGGSSNTVLHLLAAAYEGAIDFTLDDVERISRRTPCLCKLSPSVGGAHVEDLHRAGGTYALLGELARADLLDLSVPTVHMPRLSAAIERWDIRRSSDADVTRFFLAAPGGRRTTVPASQDLRFEGLDLDRETGVVRSEPHAHSRDGGIAVLRGNLAVDGCIVKTAGVDPSILSFRGRARVFESQEAAVEAILADRVAAGDVVVIRYEGPKGGPGMQEMLYPTSYLKSKRLDKACALVTDGRFSGATSGLSIGHVSPEAAEGGLIGLVEDGDPIAIDIPGRRISLDVPNDEIERRRGEMATRGADAWRPLVERPRWVSGALAAYASTTTSASTGAVRIVRR